jgi:hypothetical protein
VGPTAGTTEIPRSPDRAALAHREAARSRLASTFALLYDEANQTSLVAVVGLAGYAPKKVQSSAGCNPDVRRPTNAAALAGFTSGRRANEGRPRPR